MTDPTLPSTAAPPSLPRSVPSTLDERVAAYSSNVLPSDYIFEPTLSVDDNYMILTLIYARLSTSKRGNMACILVDPRGCASDAARHGATSSSNGATAADDDGEPPAKRARATSPSPQPFQRYPGRILAHSNNTPEPHTVPSPSNTDAATSEGGGKPARTGKKAQQSPFLARASNFPELHAEARSLCLAARSGTATAGATAYVSFPPCQACLPLLVAAGVTRLVYRQRMSAQGAVELCRREGVECVEVLDKEHDEMIKERVARWWKARGEGRDETRTRLDRWWKDQERRIVGAQESSPALTSADAADATPADKVKVDGGATGQAAAAGGPAATRAGAAEATAA